MKNVSVLALAAMLGGSIVAGAQRSPAAPTVEVYKDPTCGCCGKWVEHLRANGFTVRVTNVGDLSSVKASGGVPAQLQSCHTGKMGKYVLEGHVPAREVTRLLNESPAVAGLAVAGMPIGSPGMEVNGVSHPYDVVAFDAKGKTRVFASYGK